MLSTSLFAPIFRNTRRVFVVNSRAKSALWTVSRSLTTTSRLYFPPAKKETASKTTKSKTTKAKTTKATSSKKATGVKAKTKKPATKKVVAKRAVGRPKKVVKPEPIRRLRPEERPPKQPGSPYSLFSTEFLASNKPAVDDRLANVKECAQAWKKLSEAEKQPYVEAWEKKREQYLKDRTVYWDNIDPETIAILNKQRKKSGKQRVRRHPSDANKRPLAPYILYCQERRSHPDILKQVADISNGLEAQQRILTILGKEWKELPESEKERYKATAREAMQEWQARHSSSTSSATV